MYRDNVKNLKFLVKFMEGISITNADVARVLGCKRPILTYYFKRDDMPLSKICEIVNGFDYDIQFRLSKEDIVQDSADGINYIINTVSTVEILPRFRGKRLAYLLSYLESHGIAYMKLARDLGMGYSTLMKWLTGDDCFISNLRKIAAVLGTNLEIEIRPKSKAPEE